MPLTNKVGGVKVGGVRGMVCIGPIDLLYQPTEIGANDIANLCLIIAGVDFNL